MKISLIDPLAQGHRLASVFRTSEWWFKHCRRPGRAGTAIQGRFRGKMPWFRVRNGQWPPGTAASRHAARAGRASAAVLDPANCL